LTKYVWQIGNGGVYRKASKPAQSALCTYGGDGGYEEPSGFKIIVVVNHLIILVIVFALYSLCVVCPLLFM
jgi:hypothetical protein